MLERQRLHALGLDDDDQSSSLGKTNAPTAGMMPSGVQVNAAPVIQRVAFAILLNNPVISRSFEI